MGRKPAVARIGAMIARKVAPGMVARIALNQIEPMANPINIPVLGVDQLVRKDAAISIASAANAKSGRMKI